MGKKVAMQNNGGILGSGILGLFGTSINCDSKDDSIYCNIMKLFNLLLVLIFVGIIIYFIISLITPVRRKMRR